MIILVELTNIFITIFLIIVAQIMLKSDDEKEQVGNNILIVGLIGLLVLDIIFLFNTNTTYEQSLRVLIAKLFVGTLLYAFLHKYHTTHIKNGYDRQLHHSPKKPSKTIKPVINKRNF